MSKRKMRKHPASWSRCDQHAWNILANLKPMILDGKPDAARIRRILQEAKGVGISRTTVAKLVLLVSGIEVWRRERKQQDS